MTDCKAKKLILIGLILLLPACQSTGIRGTDSSVKNADEFELSDFAKSDIDMVFDHQVKANEQHLRALMLKLYLRNPAYWRQPGIATAEMKVEQVIKQSEQAIQKRLFGKRSIQSIQLAFAPDFHGDRVLAFVFGMRTMLQDAYQGKQEFFIMDQLDPQKLYNAARNIEVAVWKLSNDRQADGQLFLISNELQGGVKNLSFERLFGKLIAIQDISASIVADSTNRTIKNVLQGVARFVFLPI